MRALAKVVLCILGSFAASTRAETIESRDHPYKNIPAANVFRLKSPARPEGPVPLPPPKITLQGLTTVLPRPHVLFKVMMPATSSEPAKETAFVLGEGEREGEIQVLEINERAGTVRLLNHGVEQTLALPR